MHAARTNRLIRIASTTMMLALTLAASAQPIGNRLPTAEQLASECATKTVAHAHGHDHDGAGLCVELASMSVLFNPHASADEIADSLKGLDQDQFAAFEPQGSRWTFTATDGNVAQGERFTLTYSFVPDGTDVFLITTGDTAPSNLFATLDANFPGGRSAWKAKFAQAFARWGELTNINFVEVSDDGQVFPNALGQTGARGDIRIAMRPIGSPLAVNFYPQFGGDMIMDSQDIGTFTNPSNDFRSLRNVIAHEHGHGLGMKHVIPTSGTKLMEPFLNTGFDGPQEDDIRAAHFLYGDAHEPNDAFADATFIGGPLRKPTEGTVLLEEEGSLERLDAKDCYSFTAFAGSPVAMRVEPVGSAYEVGPQGGTTSVIDATAARNLAVRLWRRTSVQPLQFQMVAQIDFNEAGEAEYYPPVPQFVAGLMVAQVYSTDNVDDVQQYRLKISNVAIEATQEPAEMSVFDLTAGTQVNDGTTVRPATTRVNETTSHTLVISNTGNGPLEIDEITLQGPGAADYSFVLLQDTVQPGGSTNIGISFTPNATGQRVAVMTIFSNDADQPEFGFILSATALEPLAPEMRVSGNGQTIEDGQTIADEFFPTIDAGESHTVEFTIRNTGDDVLNISNMTLVGDVRFTASIDRLTIAPIATQTATLTITFDSQPDDGDGLFETQVTMATNDPNQATFTLNVAATTAQPLPQQDCNGNGIEDADDITNGTSEDCDGDGQPDECQTDSDNDGLIDACDAFPTIADDLDSDNDGTPDIQDGCPQDAEKTEPGECGCGVEDVDSDNDGVLDCNDAFPFDPTNGQNEDDDQNEDEDEENEQDEDDNQENDDNENDDNENNGNDENDDDLNDNEDDIDGNDEDVDDDQLDEENDDLDEVDDLDEELNEMVPLLPAPCGFGALSAGMMCMLSLAGSKSRVRRRGAKSA